MGMNRPSGPPREDRPSGPRGPRRQHRKVCAFCVEKIAYIDYKEVSRLRRFISDRGKILPRHRNLCPPPAAADHRARAGARHRVAPVHNRGPVSENQQRPRILLMERAQ